jgi:hypothetical protein
MGTADVVHLCSRWALSQTVRFVVNFTVTRNAGGSSQVHLLLFSLPRLFGLTHTVKLHMWGIV